jgi:hypothetical protein
LSYLGICNGVAGVHATIALVPGIFSVRLPPGRSGFRPGAGMVEAGGGSGQEVACSQPSSVIVAFRHAAVVAVTCFLL